MKRSPRLAQRLPFTKHFTPTAGLASLCDLSADARGKSEARCLTQVPTEGPEGAASRAQPDTGLSRPNPASPGPCWTQRPQTGVSLAVPLGLAWSGQCVAALPGRWGPWQEHEREAPAPPAVCSERRAPRSAGPTRAHRDLGPRAGILTASVDRSIGPRGGGAGRQPRVLAATQTSRGLLRPLCGPHPVLTAARDSCPLPAPPVLPEHRPPPRGCRWGHFITDDGGRTLIPVKCAFWPGIVNSH